ncbi:MAG: hypothetical protein U0L55_05945 [Acutalibacteraceae bacterium]|nr:hypothetical protein [Acutalibacteraceae bacterium]
MYYCNGCRRHFSSPEIYIERQGFSEPPFERIAVCPNCKDTNFNCDERRKRYAK